MCQETPRMQDFAPFSQQLLEALAANRPPPKFFSLASLAVLHLIFQNSLLLLKVLKALMTDEGYYDFLLFLLAIVLFVLLRYTDSDSLFDIFKLVLFQNGVVRSEIDIYLFM